MMRVPGRKVLRRALRPLRRRWFPGAVVLGYHRVADEAWDPLGLQVSSRNFAEQLEVLQEVREIVGLQSLVEHRAAGQRLDRFAVLTFDDGYVDFAETVVPATARHELPVTVFVPSGCIGGEFWWEELAALLAPGGGGGDEFEVRVGDTDGLSFTGLGDVEARRWVVNAIGDQLARADRATIDAVLAQVRAWAGEVAPRPGRARPMTGAELAAVARNARVEIGAHSVTHCYLEGLSPDEQRVEIGQSKVDLERICGRPVRVFSYPNGSLSRHSPRLVQEAGLSCACTSAEGSLRRGGDPYRIPRIWAPNLGGREFRAWLGQWIASPGEARGAR